MDETRLRAVIREEIALAVQTLADQMYDSDPESTGVSFEQAASYFTTYAYRGVCEAADAERVEMAENPFEEKTPEVDPAIKTFVHAEVQNVLREVRDTFYLSGRQDDLRIGDRLDHVITAREQAAEE